MQDLTRSIERSFVRKGIVILAFVLCATALKAETTAYVIHYLPTLGGASSTAAALNFGGMVTGWSFVKR
jgi:hypothetical protein